MSRHWPQNSMGWGVMEQAGVEGRDGRGWGGVGLGPDASFLPGEAGLGGRGWILAA